MREIQRVKLHEASHAVVMDMVGIYPHRIVAFKYGGGYAHWDQPRVEVQNYKPFIRTRDELVDAMVCVYLSPSAVDRPSPGDLFWAKRYADAYRLKKAEKFVRRHADYIFEQSYKLFTDMGKSNDPGILYFRGGCIWENSWVPR